MSTPYKNPQPKRFDLIYVCNPTWTVCSVPRYLWVTYFILSNFCNFSQLVLSTHSLLFYQFWSPYHSVVVLSSFCHLLTLCYLLTFFTLSTHPINAPAVHTTNTTLFPVLSRARSLLQYTFLTYQACLAIVPFWFGGNEIWLGVSWRTTCYV